MFLQRFKKLRRDVSGTAFTEFLFVSAPFLVVMMTATVDVASVISQYMLLTNAVNAGVRLGSTYSQIEPGKFQGLAPNSDATNCSVLRPTPEQFHSLVQSRVEDLVRLSGRRIDLTTLCVTTERRTGAAWVGKPEENTIFVQAEVNYATIFPWASSMKISVSSSGPYLTAGP